MAWKQDLAKLKQQLDPEPAAAPKPPPKPAPKPATPVVLDDEDAVFLSAMGLKRSAPKPAQAASLPAAQGPISEAPAAVEPTAPETFQEALKDLKGLKPLSKGLPDRAASTPARAVAVPKPSPAPVPVPVQASKPATPTLPEPESSAHPVVPLRFQLAAGMAIEVDASLDLRGHSLADAIERLKDRLGDGLVLGWRSLQVTLGPDPTLHEGLLALLASGQAPMVARYAQAPVPMGGTQAWLLYFGPPPAQP
ncbi:hypothetical protein GETHLI_27200 [Geothrix limicola]|uniref:Uncharacterized protein n=1 Tax=Geothrix limicola TaxID=2927978 RepID=A0ABQ5QIQ5_9BACT|nr:Smr/MutS family protein [Geothrix limicola]GLH74218.1 hypothetical protein GETHLI_27200 [Geothrix limicola]